MTKSTFNITAFYPGVFDEIQELLYFSLRELGYAASISERTIYTDATNIVFGVHTLGEKAYSLPENTIIFNLEQLTLQGGGHPVIREWTKLYLALGERYTIWDYSTKNLALWQEFGVEAKLFEFGYQKSLNRIYATHKVAQDVDVLFYGSINDRRKKVLEDLVAKGLKVKHLFNVYGKARDEWIARAKMIVNPHLYNTEIFEVVRCSYLMNNAVPVVSEVNPTTIIEPRFLAGVAGVPYDGLVEKCYELANNDGERLAQGYRALTSLSEYPQFRLLERIL